MIDWDANIDLVSDLLYFKQEKLVDYLDPSALIVYLNL